MMTNQRKPETEKRPANVERGKGSPPTLTSLEVSRAKTEQLQVALKANPLDPEAIAFQINLFEGLGYFIQPMTERQREERLRAFIKALRDIPGPFALGAFEDWFSRMPRVPSPGDIHIASSSLMGRAKDRTKPGWVREPSPPIVEPLTPEQKKRRREFVKLMAQEFPQFVEVLGDD
jgi:hypothetical protein